MSAATGPEASGADADEAAPLVACDFPDCNKAFRRRDYLERHQLNHSENPRLTCHICSRGFHRTDVLKKHIARHQPLEERQQSPRAPKRRRISSQAPTGSSEEPSVTPAPTKEHTDMSNSESETRYSLAMNSGADLETPPEFFDAYPQPAPLHNMLSHSTGETLNMDIFSWLFTSSPPESTMPVNHGNLMTLAQAADTTSLAEASGSNIPEASGSSTPRSLSIGESTKGHANPEVARGSRSESTTHLITEEKRSEMLALLTGLPSVDMDSPALSLKSLQMYIELYFLQFDPHYPIIHRPTLALRPGGPSPFVLLALVFIGTVFASDDAGFAFAKASHQRLRNRMFEMVEDNPRVDVPILQTILLVNCFGRLFSSPVTHDLSQIFHSPSIVMARFSGVFVKDSTAKTDFEASPEGWTEWALQEERKRIGWFAFIVDTSNAAMFRHTLMVHCFSMKIELPCSDGLWQSSSVSEWRQRLGHCPVLPSFLSALRSLATHGTISRELPNFSATILLNGLVSVSWALLWRDLADLSMVQDARIIGWKDSIFRALTVWQHFVQERPRSSDSDRSFYQAGLPFCFLGKILLLTETEHIRILAGAPRVAGRLILPEERAMARRQVTQWARSTDGQAAVWSALELLHLVFDRHFDDQLGDAPGTTPWCYYISVLTLWAYGFVLEGGRNLGDQPFIFPGDSSAPGEPLSLARIEPTLARKSALAFTSRLLSVGSPQRLSQMPGKSEIAGPVAYVAYLLRKVPWGIMVGPQKVLNDLLINSPR
ncbi:hypothetical protein PLICRDRAFT_175941 [Plicaturopsis crispa FD-325 SS-3]|nr:hypothetical protein PLICRDRAFT_175941 [Plicaturopsis crispa FD-325 SS-3]